MKLRYWLGICVLWAGTVVHADDIASKAALCASCHGEKGISESGEVPNLAGQKEAYLVKSIKDYRGGQRKNGMMNSLTKSLSDADINALASHYSKMK